MIQTIRLKTLAARLEYHWRRVMRYRRQVNRLYEQKALSSPQFRRRYARLSAHCDAVRTLSEAYEYLAGIRRLRNAPPTTAQ